MRGEGAAGEGLGYHCKGGGEGDDETLWMHGLVSIFQPFRCSA